MVQEKYAVRFVKGGGKTYHWVSMSSVIVRPNWPA